MGCLIGLFTWPFQLIGLLFKAVYWAFKIPWEIIEFLDHLSHRRHHRKPPTQTRRGQTTSQPASKKRMPKGSGKNVSGSSHARTVSVQLPPNASAKITNWVNIARTSNDLETRLNSYRFAFRYLEEIGATLPPNDLFALHEIETQILKEYRALMNAHTTTTGNVSFGPSFDIKTANDARRERIQGAQWSAANDACPLCQSLDGRTISITHPDFDRFIPPLHESCKCFRVYVGADEDNFETNWVTPSDNVLREHAPHLLTK